MEHGGVYLCAVAGTLRSVFEGKRLQQAEKTLDKESNGISDLHQVLAREMLLFFFLFLF